MWYNVLRGFHRKEKDKSYTFEKERLVAAKKIISIIKPDILFIGEGHFNPNCKISGPKLQTIDYKKELNFPYAYYSIPDEDSRKGEVALSKFPIQAKDFSEKTKEDNNYIKTWFNINNKIINIDLIHPYPTVPEEKKENWIKNILDKRQEPYILLGDFNALSSQDKYSFRKLVKEFIALGLNKQEAEKEIKDRLQCLMLKNVISTKLIDTYKIKNKKYSGTIPTKKYSVTGEAGTSRIDYIFCSKDFKVLNSGIIKNKLTDIASDHYPIWAELELK
jgi:endonuclease/exonuclease/phosphatase family metal-dependent hydrolase